MDKKTFKKKIIIFLVGFLTANLLNIIFSLTHLTDCIKNLLNNINLVNHYSALMNFIYYLITLVLLLILLNKDELKIMLSNFKNFDHIKKGLLIGALIIAIQLIYNTLLLRLNFTSNTNEQSVNSITIASPVLASITIILFAPLVEEITYRYCLFDGLRKINKILAYSITVVIFTLIHITFSSNVDIINELVNIPTYLLSAILLTYSYDKYGFEGSLSSHMFVNLLAIISQLISYYLVK